MSLEKVIKMMVRNEVHKMHGRRGGSEAHEVKNALDEILVKGEGRRRRKVTRKRRTRKAGVYASGEEGGKRKRRTRKAGVYASGGRKKRTSVKKHHKKSAYQMELGKLMKQGHSMAAAHKMLKH